MSQSAFRVIPVLDLKDGIAVHAVGGIRSHYGPLRSILHPDPNPVELGRAYRDILGLSELYLADLDAISGQGPNVALYRDIAEFGLSLWVDAGLKIQDDVGPLLGEPIPSIVAGLETVQGSRALKAMIDLVEPGRLVFSLDLFEGRTLKKNREEWGTDDPLELGLALIELGIRRILVLDLSRVGKRGGIGTDELIAALREASPAIELSVGGGIACVADLIRIRSAGASAVLVGSAFHDATIGPHELAELK
jgi:phosphoribosylformimino-5-aminoimidazole carboxamide ribotide isomerase